MNKIMEGSFHSFILNFPHMRIISEHTTIQQCRTYNYNSKDEYLHIYIQNTLKIKVIYHKYKQGFSRLEYAKTQMCLKRDKFKTLKFAQS